MGVSYNYPVIKRNGVAIIGESVKFERIRRVTGYLVGTLDKFNNAKRAEEKDRVKHDCSQGHLCQ